jgi:YHS domain-containing protein
MIIRNGLRTALMCFWLASAAVLTGCASQGAGGSAKIAPVDATVAGSPLPARAKCLVCEKNADLACIDVDVDSQTPSYTYDGKTYYFCSNKCRNDFAKQPAKYVRK